MTKESESGGLWLSEPYIAGPVEQRATDQGNWNSRQLSRVNLWKKSLHYIHRLVCMNLLPNKI